MNVRFDHPEWLWLLLLALPLLWLGWRSLAVLDPVRRWTAIALRLAVLVILVLMLAGLAAVQRHSDLTVVAVVDHSVSVKDFARAGGEGARDQGAEGEEGTKGPRGQGAEGGNILVWQRQWLRKATQDKRNDDRFALVTFDGRSAVRAMPSEQVQLDPGTDETPSPGTDIASAIRTGMAVFPSDSGHRLLLVTDGNDTASGEDASTLGGSPFAADDAGVLAAAREAAAAGIPIDVLPLPYGIGREVMVQALYAPTQAQRGRSLALRVVLRATEPSEGLVQLLRDGEAVDLNGDRPGTGERVTKQDWTLRNDSADRAGKYVAVKSMQVPTAFAGVERFEAVFEPTAGQDTMALNNKAQAFTMVVGKGRVLFVNNVSGPSGLILPKALASHGIALDVVPPQGIPARLAELERYDAVVLQNVPAEDVSVPQQKLIARYVNDLGGGLLMVGGPDSFGAGGWTHSPIDRILPVNCQIPSQTVLPSGALVLVIDHSGSMGASVAGSNRNQQELANEAAVLALNTLYPQDLVGVVVFDSSATAIVPVGLNRDPAAIAAKVRSIQPAGGTEIYSGLELAYRQLAPLTVRDAAIKHIILLTDGNSTAPSGSGGYVGLVAKMHAAGITLSTVGVGDGANAKLLKQLASMGSGHFYAVRNPNHLPRIFIKEAKTIRKNLIKETPFQPRLRRTGSPIMRGINAVPKLQGLVLTGPKHDPRVFEPIVGAEGEPVFAHWQVGLGRTAAFTSDATNRWATQWLQWGGYADFWARTLRYIARPSRSRDLDLATAVHGKTLHIRLDASATDQASNLKTSAGFENFLSVVGGVIDPDGSVRPVRLHQTGPGVYEADVPAEATGDYIVRLFAQGRDGKRQMALSGAAKPIGAELRRLQPNLALLKEVARITGGRLLDPAKAVPTNLYTRSGLVVSRSLRPLWRTLLVILLVVFLLDVACRRVAWEVGATIRWLRQRAAVLGQLVRPREVEAAATLAALKHRREAVRDASAPQESGRESGPSPSLRSGLNHKHKFEAQSDATVSDDFAGAVGGAKADAPPSPPPEETAPAGQTQEQTTNRLLAAKRRARQNLGESDD